MKRRKQFCTKEVEFPAEGWMAIISLVRDDGLQVNYPLYPLFTSWKFLRRHIYEFEKDVRRQELEIEKTVKVVSISFDKRVGLKKAYWGDAKYHYGPLNRADDFERALKYGEMYRLLVTPNELVGNRFGLVVALPILKVRLSEDIKRFMALSDFPVNTQAKSAAVYKITKVVEVDWTEEEAELGRTKAVSFEKLEKQN